ncbi:MAG: hypothetical protein KGZ86_05065 [Candidatus Latescibacteria bacterium]|nr:hypothetical protein [Candidatus Latescibacterota bacterium]
MTTTTFSLNKLNLRGLWLGAIAGIIGGIPFGMLMGMMGMLPMVGMLVRVEDAFVGFGVHMVISIVTGAMYGFFAPLLPQNWRTAFFAGMIYGVAWWVLGALVLMPILLGMPQMVFMIGEMQWFSLMGHIIFGLGISLSFLPMYRRAG